MSSHRALTFRQSCDGVLVYCVLSLTFAAKDRKSPAWRSTAPRADTVRQFSSCFLHILPPISHLRTCFIRLTSEVFDVETNKRVSDTYSSMQMPKVENKIIVIDDYSTWGGVRSVTVKRVSASLIKLSCLLQR